jgi:hypothetical protein
VGCEFFENYGLAATGGLLGLFGVRVARVERGCGTWELRALRGVGETWISCITKRSPGCGSVGFTRPVSGNGRLICRSSEKGDGTRSCCSISIEGLSGSPATVES